MKYKVIYEYRGRVTVEVDAESEDAAEKAGMAEADELIHSNLSIYHVTIREPREHDGTVRSLPPQ